MTVRPSENQLRIGGALQSSRSLDVEALAARYGGVTILRLKAGARIYRQGEPADAMFYLQHGQVQITVVSSHGKEGNLGVLHGGSFCGEGCLLGNRVRVATAVCLADSVVARLERGNVIRAIRSDPAIAEFFVAFALRSLFRLRENLISQLFDSSEQRLARALLLLANHDGDFGADDLIRNIDQESLAQMIGTTRSRVNQFMNKFRKLGYIDYDCDVIAVHRSLSHFALGKDTFGAPDDDIAVAC